MEILTPQPIQESTPNPHAIPNDLMGEGISMKSVEFLNHFGLKDEMFNEKVMDKIGFISEHVEDLLSLQDIDVRLGTEFGESKLDKVYAYLKLNEQADRVRQHEQLIREQMRKYESS